MKLDYYSVGRKRVAFYINTGGKWWRHNENTLMNYRVFYCRRAALRYFKANPNRDQIDIRGVCSRKGKKQHQDYCWKYRRGRKIITQQEQ